MVSTLRNRLHRHGLKFRPVHFQFPRCPICHTKQESIPARTEFHQDSPLFAFLSRTATIKSYSGVSVSTPGILALSDESVNVLATAWAVKIATQQKCRFVRHNLQECNHSRSIPSAASRPTAHSAPVTSRSFSNQFSTTISSPRTSVLRKDARIPRRNLAKPTVKSRCGPVTERRSNAKLAIAGALTSRKSLTRVPDRIHFLPRGKNRAHAPIITAGSRSSRR